MLSAMLGILLVTAQDPTTVAAAAVRPLIQAQSKQVEQQPHPGPASVAFRDADRFRAVAVVPPPLAGPAAPRPLGVTGGVVGAANASGEGSQLQDYSDAYYTRLTIHRIASYATVPLFITEFLAGQELLNEGSDAAGWAKSVHGPIAGALAGLFVVNTVTGGWNLIESRRDPVDRKWRTAHSVLMLLADAGFAATGITASEAEGDDDGGDRSGARTHRAFAISSMGVALAGYLMMLPPLRRD